MTEKIVQYSPSYKILVKEFLKQARYEGSGGTYTQHKFDIDKGRIRFRSKIFPSQGTITEL